VPRARCSTILLAAGRLPPIARISHPVRSAYAGGESGELVMAGNSIFMPGRSMQMGSLADPDALRCVSDLPPPFCPVFGFRCDHVSWSLELLVVVRCSPVCSCSVACVSLFDRSTCMWICRASVLSIWNPGEDKMTDRLWFFLLCRYFNSLQSECFHVCFLSDVNMVISAPTGSGKTVLFDLCILRILSRFLSPDWRFNLRNGTLKTVRVNPNEISSKSVGA
jgi:hypothetical protein